MNSSLNKYVYNISGVLSDVGIEQCRKNGELAISPFSKEYLTGLGYNLTPTDFIFSTKRGVLEKTYNHLGEKYIYIKPHDTVLVLTREAVYVNKNIMGTFHTKVKMSTSALGLYSTTLDPGWQGPLLIAITNLGNTKKKLVLKRDCTVKDSGYEPIATVIFYKITQPSSYEHDNVPYRLEILKQYIQKLGKKKSKEIYNILSSATACPEGYKPFTRNDKNFVKKKFKKTAKVYNKNVEKAVNKMMEFNKKNNLFLLWYNHKLEFFLFIICSIIVASQIILITKEIIDLSLGVSNIFVVFSVIIAILLNAKLNK